MARLQQAVVKKNAKSFNFINTNNFLHFFTKTKIQRKDDGCLASRNIRLRDVGIRNDCFACYSSVAYYDSIWISVSLNSR